MNRGSRLRSPLVVHLRLIHDLEHGSVEARSPCTTTPCSISIHALGLPLPRWAAPLRAVSKPVLEIVALAEPCLALRPASTASLERMIFYDEAIAEFPLLPGSIRIAAARSELEGAMDGLVSIFTDEGLIGIDWADIRAVAGVSDGHETACPASVPAAQGRAAVLPGAGVRGNALGREVRHRLAAMDREGFSGGILLNIRLSRASARACTLQGLDDFIQEALAGTSRLRLPATAVAATIEADQDRVCVYAFRPSA